MTEKQKRLEKALLELIERETNGQQTEPATICVPAAAHELIELWRLQEY